jgi:hypothetical protein
MRIILILLLVCLALGIKDLSAIEDIQLGPLLAGDWQSLLPDELQNTKAQLIKLLTPSPPAAPQHASTYPHHFRLARTETEF